MIMVKKLIFFLFLICFYLFFSYPVNAQSEETLEGIISNILEERTIKDEQGQRLYQKLEVLITKGSLKDKKVEVEVGDLAIVNQPEYKKGDKLLLTRSQDIEGNDVFYISDFIRRKTLYLLFFIFIILVIIITGFQGFGSVVGMAFSFLVILKYVLPQILTGREPILVAIIASIFIIPPTFYLSHGLNKKTTVAIISSFIALIITSILATVFISLTRLTGFVSDEAAFLQVMTSGKINIKGLLLAGIIIGALGILDDITISQAAVVKQLKEVNKKASKRKIFKKAIKVGQDHIASMVNTLILVYTGAALPLLLLFINNPHPFTEIINYEIVSEEIIRTLVSSIGLILAVPITTLLAALFI